MQDPSTYSPDRSFVHNIVNELNELYAESFKPTPDIDLVWAMSSIGTVKEVADLGRDNPYSGVLWDKGIVDSSVQLVLEVTALRVGKSIEELTPDDVEAHGPTLLYNGETPGIPNSKFPQQNAHFEELISEPGFPIPRSKIVIGEIDDANTPAQVRNIAAYLHDNDDVKKVAVVCGLPHTTRVGRYIEHHKELFESNLEFVAAPVQQNDFDRQSKIAAVEIAKARIYGKKGDLAIKSVFFDESPPNTRPDILKDLKLKKP